MTQETVFTTTHLLECIKKGSLNSRPNDISKALWTYEPIA